MYMYCCVCTTWVIPSHVNKNFDMTVSELNETWYAGSAFGFVMTKFHSHSLYGFLANEKFDF